MLLMAISCGIDLGSVQIGTLLLVSKKIVIIVVNMREKKNEIMNEEEVRKLVECPKQQYWSKYCKEKNMKGT